MKFSYYIPPMQTGVLSFNHPHLTSQCVAQALKFVRPQDLVLLHNGSKPENVELLKSEFPLIHHLTLDQNRGFTGGTNSLLREIFSRSKWAFFLTNDCLLQSAPRAPEHPGLYAPQIFRRKIGRIDSLGGWFYPLTGKLRHIREEDRAQTQVSAYNRRPFSYWRRWANAFRGYFYVPGTAFYLDQKTFQKVGPFDESLHTYWEDVDFSVRAHIMGQNLGLCPETKIIHKVGKTCHKDPYYTNYLFQKNRSIIRNRYNPWPFVL